MKGKFTQNMKDNQEIPHSNNEQTKRKNTDGGSIIRHVINSTWNEGLLLKSHMKWRIIT